MLWWCEISSTGGGTSIGYNYGIRTHIDELDSFKCW